MKPMTIRKALANETDIAVAYLYEATARYVESRNGSVIVAGGVQLIQSELEPKFNFSISVRCTGQIPKLASQTKEKE